MRVVVLTSDKYAWAMLPFSYLFNIHWSELQPVDVYGFARPNFKLPPNFTFHSIDRNNYPANRWSDALIRVLQSFDDLHFVFMLEDYWLCRTVDVRGVDACHQYVRNRPRVLRIDLTDDRLYAGGMFDVEAWGSYDIIETPHGTPYQMSTQAGIWNRQLMLSLLEPGKSAWEVEVQVMPPDNMRVLGTRQRPIRYANAILKGKLDKEQVNRSNRIPDPHRARVLEVVPQEFIGE